MLFLVLASFFSAPALAEQDAPALPGSGFAELRRAGTAEVISIIDPLTVQLNDGRLIRLSGLEYPDLTVHEAGEFSVTAIKILKDMLLEKAVNIYQTKKPDRGRLNRMGHHIAHLERVSDQVWIQGMMVKLGLARVRTTQRNPEMAEELYAFEDKAREAGLGVWENEAFEILNPEETPEHIDSFQIVEGRIESAALKNNRIYLNFGKDWRSDFTVSIAPRDKRAFSRAGLDPLGWGGQHVRVRGWLESYNGAYMEINHPQAIQLLDKSDSNALPDAEEGSMVKPERENH